MLLDKFKKPRSPHNRQWGLYKGLIVNVIPTDHDDNSTRDRLEYSVKIDGQLYPNAIDIRNLGGVYNYSETIRQGSEDGNESTFDEKRDGEFVLVGFVKGHGDIPIILGALEHPKHPKYEGKKSSKANGRRHVFEYNGVEFKIDKNGNLTLEQVGLRDVNGNITNTNAVGSKISIDGTNGNIDITLADLPSEAKVTIGNSQAELLDIIDQLITNLELHKHVTLGVTSTPPDTSALLINLRTLQLALIKG